MNFDWEDKKKEGKLCSFSYLPGEAGCHVKREVTLYRIGFRDANERGLYLSDEQTKSNRPKERQQSSIKKKDWDFVIERLLLFAPSAPLLFFFL